MRTLVVDDNTAYARALATDIGDGSESLLDGESLSTLDEAETELKNRIDGMQSEENAASLRLLINRELKLNGRKRQEGLGEKLYERMTWKYPDVPFRLYSFRSQEVTAPCTQLPFTADHVPTPSEEALLEAKVRACLAYMDETFDEVQHDFEKVGATTVNLVRLIYGAVLSQKITGERQISDLLDALVSFGSAEQDDKIESFVDGAQGLMKLLRRQADTDISESEDSETSYRRVVIVDDEASEGNSPWATVLNILFDRDAYEFEFRLPSEAEENLSDLRSADLILLDINFSQDPSYSGPTRYGGLDLLEKLQTLAPDLPVIVMSSYDEIGLYEACLEAGAHNYLTKQWSEYTKHGSTVTEKQWFAVWEQTISAPLQHGEFFKDVWRLRSRNLAASALANLHEALREIGSPNLSTARALASFLDVFARSYAKYNSNTVYGGGKKLRTLRDRLRHPELASPRGTIRTNRILRKMRNSIVHNERYIDSELDVWLFLVLLRVLLLRGLDATSTDRRSWTTGCSWMHPFAKKYAKALSECSTDVDEDFFETTEAGRRDYYGGLLNERKQLMEQLRNSVELSPEQFGRHIDLFIRLLAPLIQPDQGFTGGEATDEKAVLQIVRSLKAVVKTRDGNSYKERFEVVSAVRWLIDTSDDFKFLRDADEQNERQNRLRWFLAVRCWVWYFKEFIGKPNEMLFDRFRRHSAAQSDSYLKRPDENLVNYLEDRGLNRYIASYALLIACGRVQRKLNHSRDERMRRLEKAESTREAIEERMGNLEIEALAVQIAEKKSDLDEAKRRLIDAGSDSDSAYDHYQSAERLEAKIEHLRNQRAEELQTLRDLEEEKEETHEEEERLKAVLAAFPNYEETSFSIESMERLGEVLRLGLADIAARRNQNFDAESYISNLCQAEDFEDVAAGIAELDALIN